MQTSLLLAYQRREIPPLHEQLGVFVRRRPLAAAAVLMLAAAFVLRAALIGDPLAGFDEQLYQLVGERMWQGALPYVDLWDRKPLGLFVAFWLFNVGGHGIAVGQVAATLSAAATAWMVVVIARRHVALTPAILAGLFYLVSLRILGGQTTQTPVFYNLFVAIAAWAVLTAPALSRSGGSRRVAVAMFLSGIAIQFKPTAALDGVLFGCVALADLRRAGASWTTVARHATAYALLGSTPTLAAIGFYAGLGQFDAFWYANVQSIFARSHLNDPDALATLVGSLGGAGPVIAFAAIGLRRRFATDLDRRDAWILLLWSGTALAQFFLLGSYWCHYLLPFLLVGSIASASCFAAVRRPQLVFAIVAVAPVLLSTVWDARAAAGDRRIVAEAVAAMPPGVDRGCLFMYEGQPIFYDLVHACTVTRFVFTDHLRSSREQGALGVDAAAEMRRVLARRPLAIGAVRNSSWVLRNRENDRLLAAALRRDYRLRAELPYSSEWGEDAMFQIWVLRPELQRKL